MSKYWYFLVETNSMYDTETLANFYLGFLQKRNQKIVS